MNVHAPIKLGDRQEQFCQQILSGKSYAEAYRIAYGASQSASEANGPRLIRSDRVQARIAQLRADWAAAERVTIPFLTRELFATAAEARAALQHGAAVSAYTTIGKMHGLLTDKLQVDVAIRKPSALPDSPDDMTETAWLESAGLVIEHLTNQTTSLDHMIEDSSPIDQATSVDQMISTPGLHPESGGNSEWVPGAKRSEDLDELPSQAPPPIEVVSGPSYNLEPESQNPMPMKSQKQRGAMHAAAAGKSKIGIPKSVAKKFVAHDTGGKLPKKAKARKS
jgi:hypothetical protein